MINIEKINRRIFKVYGDKVVAHINHENNSIVVCGKLDNWDDVVNACKLAVYNKDGYHVVNEIEYTGEKLEEIRKPLTYDTTLDNKKVDVLIVGGGICGCAIARELSKYKLDILVVEKESDVAMGASGRNDGEVHPGIDQKSLNLKLKYELLGNKMYPQICEELGVPFKRVGQYAVFKGLLFKPIVRLIVNQRKKIGVEDSQIISKKELYKANPSLNEGFDFAIYNPSAGIVCPYGLTIAYGENAVSNGVQISLNTVVLDMSVENKHIISVTTNKGTIYPKIVINAAGVYSDMIAKMAHDQFFSIHPRKGTDLILDSKVGNITNSVISYTNLLKREKNTKGGGILPTVDGNILLGPDAKEIYQREDISSDVSSLNHIISKQQLAIGSLNVRDVITYFSGVRAASYEEDFIIEKGRCTNNIIHCAAIQSPGLTAAPAIALEIERLTIEMLGKAERNEKYNPIRKPIVALKKLDDQARDKMIKENPDYGVIVCRCEQISKGEIIDALKSPICVPTIDGIKKRVRPGMGRCQGGFCSPQVHKIIAQFMNKEIKDINKNNEGSTISYGDKS